MKGEISITVSHSRSPNFLENEALAPMLEFEDYSLPIWNKKYEWAHLDVHSSEKTMNNLPSTTSRDSDNIYASRRSVLPFQQKSRAATLNIHRKEVGKTQM